MGLSREQYTDIISRYDEIRTRNSIIRENRIREVYASHPEFKGVQDEIVSLSVSEGKNILSREDSLSRDEYHRRLKSLSEKKKALLASYGMPEDYLDPIYTCPDCQDTGYTDGRPCHCFISRAIDIMYAQSGLREILETENFDHFNINYYPDHFDEKNSTENTVPRTPRENIRRIYRISRDFAENFDSHSDNLLFYGNTGVGKTFMTHCIAKSLLDTSHSVVYLSAIELFDILGNRLRDRNYDSYMRDHDVHDYISNADLLIIDDLGTELSNSFTDSRLYNIINQRILKKRSTIISTNLSFSDLRKRYSDRIFSRMTGYYIFCLITGPDIRSLKLTDAV